MIRGKSEQPRPKDVAAGFIQLLRPLNAVMSMAGVFIGYSLAYGGFHFDLSLVYALLAVFCISGAGQAINDYFDYEIDRKRKKNRPLVRGAVSKQAGLLYALALFGLGVTLASFLTELAFLTAVFFSVLLILYSATMQKIKFVGNVIVSLGVAFTFIFGASVITVTPLVLMIALPAFFANWAREVIKDVEDADSDREHKLTLPHVLKKKQVEVFVIGLFMLAIVLSYIPVILKCADWKYAVLVTLSNLVFILAGKELFQKHAEKAQSMTKKGMLIGLLAQLSLLI